jgi:GrpB-like predicted nucleotidyltransferase (UPF0157 family)
VLYLVSTVEAVVSSGLGFVFTDGHAVMSPSEYYEYLSDLDEIDWPLMSATYWNDALDDPDRKRRRQAEHLVHQSMPWQLVHEVVVRGTSIEHQVADYLKAADDPTPARSYRRW